MNALARTDYAAWSLAEAVVCDLMRRGAHVFDERVSARGCGELLAEIRRGRRFDAGLFLTEEEFEQELDAPAGDPGRSLLDGLDGKLDFAERAPHVVEALWSLLGPDYRVLQRELVCLLPEAAIPQWVKRRVHGVGDGELTAFVRPEHRDIGYRAGLDLRQEPDAGERPGEAVTLDIYLHSVAETDGPIALLEGSHRMGASDGPANLTRTGPGAWRYRDARRGEMYLVERALTGDVGFAVLRHGWTLAGDAKGAEHERITLQYRFCRGSACTAGVDAVNADLAG